MLGITDTSSKSYRELFGNGLTYSIPKFQRDYSWDVEQWDDLWQDIMDLMGLGNAQSSHYMGYLVLQTADNKNFKVIDGQQRLTTISIIILVVLKRLKALEDAGMESSSNKQRRDAIHNSYIGYLDPITLISRNKLSLNRNNDAFFRNYLVTLKDLPSRNLKATERLMRNCFAWYEERITREFATGAALAQFVETIVDKLFFTSIKVSDEINAFKVFETLNARGVQLSSSDLLKNHLFSIVDATKPHDIELAELENLWSIIIDTLGNERLPEFIRIYWNSQNKTTSKADLFKTIRSAIGTKQQVFELLRSLGDEANIYVALTNPYDELWSNEKQIQTQLKTLQLFKVRQPLSLLMAAHRGLDINGLKNVLRSCVIVSFRYNVIGGRNPKEQEKVYNDIALSIRNTKRFNADMLQPVYPTDSEFEAEFANKEIRPSMEKMGKFILAELERYVSGHEVDYTGETNSLEHILPMNPGSEWPNISDEQLNRSVLRLGNLALLERTYNKTLANQDFEFKKAVYLKSSFTLTRKVAEDFQSWDEEQIIVRQRDLARKAKTVWRLDF